jgi:hypothetical protein
MAAPRFRYRPALAELPKGAERSLVAQFKAIENDLNSIRGVDANSPPVITGAAYACHVGELVRISPPATGQLLTIPPGRAENISQTIRIAVVGGVLSPGATVSIVGGEGTINGQAALFLNSFRLVELVSCGEPGWFFST